MLVEISNETFRANMISEIKSIQKALNELKIVKSGIVKKSTKRKTARNTVKRKTARNTVKRKTARNTVKRKTVKAKRKTNRRR